MQRTIVSEESKRIAELEDKMQLRLDMEASKREQSVVDVLETVGAAMDSDQQHLQTARAQNRGSFSPGVPSGAPPTLMTHVVVSAGSRSRGSSMMVSPPQEIPRGGLLVAPAPEVPLVTPPLEAPRGGMVVSEMPLRRPSMVQPMLSGTMIPSGARSPMAPGVPLAQVQPLAPPRAPQIGSSFPRGSGRNQGSRGCAKLRAGSGR